MLPTAASLDGSARHDADDDPLRYQWSVVAKPAGSAPVITAPSAAMTNLSMDRAGTYLLQLVVNDGSRDSEPDTMSIVASTNLPPNADAGFDQLILLPALGVLEGSASGDADLDALSYRWTVVSQPAGSAASIGDSSAKTTALSMDLAGSYVVQLIVNDGIVDSAPDTVSLIAKTNQPPVADAGSDREVLLSEPAILDGDASSDPDGDPLDYR